MSGQKVARLGDSVSGTCTAHRSPVSVTGNFTECSGVCTADGIGVVLVGHKGTASCGHGIQATSGSSVFDVGGIPVVRVGDSFIMISGGSGGGVVVAGSPNVDSL